MTRSIDLPSPLREMVVSITARYPFHFYAYGSRVKGKAKRLSDLDLVILEDVQASQLESVREAFEESDLPIKVDVSVWSELSDEFRQQVQDDLTPL
jgi:predicted nucleotidyltransferase